MVSRKISFGLSFIIKLINTFIYDIIFGYHFNFISNKLAKIMFATPKIIFAPLKIIFAPPKIIFPLDKIIFAPPLPK